MSKILALQRFSNNQVVLGQSTSSIFCGGNEAGLSTCSIDCGGGGGDPGLSTASVQCF